MPSPMTLPIRPAAPPVGITPPPPTGSLADDAARLNNAVDRGLINQIVSGDAASPTTGLALGALLLRQLPQLVDDMGKTESKLGEGGVNASTARPIDSGVKPTGKLETPAVEAKAESTPGFEAIESQPLLMEKIITTDDGEKRLQNADQAIIDPRKLTDYALNPDHPVGGNKAKVFDSALGFNQDNADELERQLKEGLQNVEPVEGKADQYGTRFTVDIPVDGPSGSGTVRTGWIYKPGSDKPEMTTLFVK